MHNASGGSEQVVANALQEHQRDFESFVRARVPADAADDILQVAALRALERAHTLDDDERVVAWLYRIHRNLIIDSFRQRATERRYVEPASQPPEAPIPDEADPCKCGVSQAGRLRPAYAAILSMVDFDGLSLSEAARKLNVSANNATVRLHRARKALRESMQEHCGVFSPDDCASCLCVEAACCVV